MDSIKSPSFLLYLSFFYSYYLPIILYVLWTPLSLYDLGKREDSSKNILVFWVLLIITLPWLGSLIYLFLGKNKISLNFKLALVVPGLVLIIFFALYATLTST